MVGSVSTVTYKRPASLWRLAAPAVLAICIKLSIPSCIRAPPLAVKKTMGNPFSRAVSKARVIRSPAAEPMEAIINRLSITPMTQGLPWMEQIPVTTASNRPVARRVFSSLRGNPQADRVAAIRLPSSSGRSRGRQ